MYNAYETNKKKIIIIKIKQKSVLRFPKTCTVRSYSVLNTDNCLLTYYT